MYIFYYSGIINIHAIRAVKEYPSIVASPSKTLIYCEVCVFDWEVVVCSTKVGTDGEVTGVVNLEEWEVDCISLPTVGTVLLWVEEVSSVSVVVLIQPGHKSSLLEVGTDLVTISSGLLDVVVSMKVSTEVVVVTVFPVVMSLLIWVDDNGVVTVETDDLVVIVNDGVVTVDTKLGVVTLHEGQTVDVVVDNKVDSVVFIFTDITGIDVVDEGVELITLLFSWGCEDEDVTTSVVDGE